MLTSKGCPFRCSYCASSSLYTNFSQRPPDEVIGEIEYYQKDLGVTDIAFYDDALLVNDHNHNGRIDDGTELFGNAGGAWADPIPWQGRPWSIKLSLPPLATLVMKR